MKAGSKIKMLRESLGLRQQDVALYLKVSRELISMIENNEREINLENLEKLADLFGIELIELVDDKSDNVTIKAALSFRADEIQTSDLEQISKFQSVVKNYLKMQTLINENRDDY
jgi:transcriptional regulator with XRE-family HTH domain